MKLHKDDKKELKIAYNDSSLNYKKLLAKATMMSIHHKNLQLYLTEIYQPQRNFNVSFMSKILWRKIFHTPFVVAELFKQQNRTQLGMPIFLDLKYLP